MKENPLKHKYGMMIEVKSGGTNEVITTCPKCGGEAAIWSEGPDTTCVFCRYRLFEREATVH